MPKSIIPFATIIFLLTQASFSWGASFPMTKTPVTSESLSRALETNDQKVLHLPADMYVAAMREANPDVAINDVADAAEYIRSLDILPLSGKHRFARVEKTKGSSPIVHLDLIREPRKNERGFYDRNIGRFVASADCGNVIDGREHVVVFKKYEPERIVVQTPPPPPPVISVTPPTPEKKLVILPPPHVHIVIPPSPPSIISTKVIVQTPPPPPPVVSVMPPAPEKERVVLPPIQTDAFIPPFPIFSHNSPLDFGKAYGDCPRDSSCATAMTLAGDIAQALGFMGGMAILQPPRYELNNSSAANAHSNSSSSSLATGGTGVGFGGHGGMGGAGGQGGAGGSATLNPPGSPVNPNPSPLPSGGPVDPNPSPLASGDPVSLNPSPPGAGGPIDP